MSTTLSLRTESTAFLLVDTDGAGAEDVIVSRIAPALPAARSAGLRIVYFHEDAYGIGGPGDITRELAGGRLDALRLPPPV